MNRTLKSLSILIIAVLALIVTSCSSGKTKIVEKKVTVTSIVYRDATTTSSTAPAPQEAFTAEEITWEHFCSQDDDFCADFPEAPGDDNAFSAYPLKMDDGRIVNVYVSDLDRGFQSNEVVFCNNVLAAACQQDNTDHGVNADAYAVFVQPDRDPSLNIDEYDKQFGDCGGRPDRVISPIMIGSYQATKITCRYSYNTESTRTLYYMRRAGKVYEVNASNQTAKPYFGQKFLDSFTPTK